MSNLRDLRAPYVILVTVNLVRDMNDILLVFRVVRQWTLGELLKRWCDVDIVHRGGPALSLLFLGRLMRKRTAALEILQQTANLTWFDGCMGVLACLPDGQVEEAFEGAVPVVHRGDHREQE